MERRNGRRLIARAARAAALLVAATLGATLAATPARAQYFGQNKVQYRTYDWQVLHTEHFDIYFYPEEREAVNLTARIAEKWYSRLSTFFGHQLSGRQPLIVYATQSQFQSTNAIPGDVGEGTGGVTEALLRRIVLPIGGPLKETNHVLAHELVHAFQYDITGRPGMQAQGMPAAAVLPLWFIEGMAEYLSLGPEYAHTAMWVRDASVNKLPSYGDLEDPRFFPYRFGHALLAYVGGRWGDEAIPQLLRSAARQRSVDRAIQEVLRISPDSLMARWHREVHVDYDPLLATTRSIDSIARPVASTAKNERMYNVSPAISPDGKWMIYLSDRGLFSIDLFLADAHTGKVVGQIASTALDPHYQSLEFLYSAGAFDHTGKRFVFTGLTKGRPVLVVYDVERRTRVREIPLATLGDAFSPTWSPDDRYIAFSGLDGALSDLYVYDVQRDSLERLTNDAYAELQPAWSPDGRTIAFATDRFTTSLQPLVPGNYRIATYDVATRAIRSVGPADSGKQINPQWAPDGRSIYYLSDRTGITNLYRLELDQGRVTQLTDLFAGISGITDLSPALSVAQETGDLLLDVFTDMGYAIYRMDAPQAPGAPFASVTPSPAGPSPALLPPQDRVVDGIWALGRDSLPGVPADTQFAVTAYHGKMQLIYAGQPTLTAGLDRFGSYVGGGVALYFGDLLGNYQLTTVVQTAGSFKNLGAIVAYENDKGRLGWGASISQVPYLTGSYQEGFTSDPQYGQVYAQQQLIDRQTNRALSLGAWYPFNRASRVELSGGFLNVDFSRELTTDQFDVAGNQVSHETIDLDSPPSLNMAQATAAYVFDNSIFGATSPIAGRRMRLDLTPYVGSITIVNALADLRQYWMPARPITFATRLLHYGRYGTSSEDDRLTPLFLGYDGLVRGYTFGSFTAAECSASAQAAGTGANSCPVFDKLLGSRMLVGNAELRAPLFGLLGVGSGYYGVFPIEVGIFGDAGVAWNSGETPKLFGGTRQLAASAGLLARINLLGFAILEVDYVRPFDRPGRKSLWQFSFQPGF